MSLRSILSAGAVLLTSGYLLFSFLGPNGLPMVIQKRRQIRELRETNAELEQGNYELRKRIQGIAENPAERERAAREQLQVLKKNETTFIIQGQKKK